MPQPGLLILLFGFTFARHILTMMNTKPELIAGAVRYLRIYVLVCQRWHSLTSEMRF